MIKFRSFKPGITWLTFTKVRFYSSNSFEDMTGKVLEGISIQVPVELEFKIKNVETDFKSLPAKDTGMFEIFIGSEFDIPAYEVLFNFKANEVIYPVIVPVGSIDFGLEM